jgi:hypothetical protein
MTYAVGIYYSPDNVTDEEAETTLSSGTVSSIDEEVDEAIYEPPVADLPEAAFQPPCKGPDWYKVAVDLWMVVEIDKKGFSEKLEYDAELDLILAPEGNFVGIAATKIRADEMTTSRAVSVPIRNENGDRIGEEVVAEHVYLTYKATIKGTTELKKLLAFLKSEGMLQHQG